MYCKKCGNEILEGDKFCSVCGIGINQNIQKNIDTKGKNKEIKIKLHTAIIVSILVILSIMTIITISINKNKEQSNYVETNEGNTNEITTKKLQIGNRYIGSNNEYNASAMFNENGNFDLLLENSKLGNQKIKGTYTIDSSNVLIRIDYDSGSIIDESGEELSSDFEERDEIIKILSDTTIEYNISSENSIILEVFDKKENNLFKEILKLYPQLEDFEDIICTDGDLYWILDGDGHKIYFDDIDTFEKAWKDVYDESVSEYLNEDSLKIDNDNDDNTVDNDELNNGNKKEKNSTNQVISNNDYINVPDLTGMTEKEAIVEAKRLGVKYEITYMEDTSYEEGIVIGQTEHTKVLTDIRGEIVAGYILRTLLPR